MQHAERSERRRKRWRLEAEWRELVRRGVIYASVCEEEDDRVIGRSETGKWRKRKKCGDGGAASWLTVHGKEHACSKNRFVEKTKRRVFGADEKR